MNETKNGTTSNRVAGGKHLTFSLMDETFGIEVNKLKEIIGMVPINTVPQTPNYIRGVINLRGKVIPVIDLRLRFGMPPVPDTDRTCIIIVEIGGEARTLTAGMVVDSVSEVTQLKSEDIETAPDFGMATQKKFIRGLAKSADGIKILLEIDNVLNQDEKENLIRAA